MTARLYTAMLLSAIERPSTTLMEGDQRPGTTLPHEDPRAYLMKRQKSISRNGHRVKRMHTGRLPLETVPQAEEMHGLVLTMSIKDATVLEKQMLQTGR